MIPEHAFYINKKNIKQNFFYLDKSESHHAANVLRLSLGESIILLDGMGTGYFAKINNLDSEHVSGSIQKIIKNLGENKHSLHIAPGIIKKHRFELLLEKVTELGVNEIHPLIMKHSIKKTINMGRCKKIITSAAKQCRRSFFPILHQPKTLSSLLNSRNNFNYFVGRKDSVQKIRFLDFKKNDPSCFIIGPEGGFAKTETDLMKSKNVVQFSLGNRRLRSETAALAAIATHII